MSAKLSAQRAALHVVQTNDSVESHNEFVFPIPLNHGFIPFVSLLPNLGVIFLLWKWNKNRVAHH